MSPEVNSQSGNKIRVIVAYSGAHPAHQKLLANCCSSSIKMLGEWSVDGAISNKKKLKAHTVTAWKLRSNPAEIIIIEGTIPTIIMAPLIKLLNHRPKIIALCGEDALYQAFVAGRSLLRVPMYLSFRFVSGIIASGDLVTKLAREHFKTLPVETIYPQVDESKLKSLVSLKPSLNSHNMILIGGRDEHVKGLDIAIECLEAIRATFPDAQLTVLGFPKVKERPGVTSPGAVSDIKPYLSASSVLIHPGRGEAFGLVIMEAMLAGVIPFVSEWTGAASLAIKASPELVAPLKAEEFAKRIAAFWSAPEEYRQELSEKCRQVAREFAAQTANQPSLTPFIESFHG